MKYTYFIFLVLLLVTGCSRNTQVVKEWDGKARVVTLKSFTTDNSYSGLSYLDSVKFVSLETVDESLLGNIKVLEICNDTIVAMDDNYHLISFDLNGNFVKKYGNEGYGPDEYVSLSSFFFDGEKLGLIDVVSSKILYFNLRGDFIKKVNFPVGTFAGAHFFQYTNGYLLTFNIVGSSYGTCAARIYDINKMKSICIDEYPISECANSMAYIHPLSRLSDTISFISPLSDTIYCFDGKEVFPGYIIEHSEPLITGKFMEDYLLTADPDDTFMSFLLKAKEKGFYTGLSSVFETEDLLLMNSLNEGMGYNAIWNKKTHSGKKIKTMSEKGEILFSGNMLGSTKNAFISTLNMSLINILIEANELNVNEYPGLSQLIDSYDYEDNPVLMFIYLNESAF